MPTAVEPRYLVTYREDRSSIEHGEDELRNWIDILQFPEWRRAIDAVKEAYNYLENRVTDNCQTPYHCSGPYEVCRVSQLFDPSFAVDNVTPNIVAELCAAIPALSNAADALKAELEAYRVASRTAPMMDHSEIHAFTESVLEF